jgi:hypothetical protein
MTFLKKTVIPEDLSSELIDLIDSKLNTSELSAQVIGIINDTIPQQTLPYYKCVEDLMISTTTSVDWQDKLLMTTGALDLGIYKISCSYQWNMDDESQDFMSTLSLTESGNDVTLLSHREEPKSKDGAFGDTGTDQMYAFTAFVTRQMSGECSLSLRYRSSKKNKAASIWNARIDIQKMSSDLSSLSSGVPVVADNLLLPENGGNLISFTSEYGWSWNAARLTDSITTDAGWASARDPGPQTFIYSFLDNNSAILTEGAIHAGTAEGRYFSKDVEVWVSADAINYTKVYSGRLPRSQGLLAFDLNNVVAKRVKLVITSGYDNNYWELSEFIIKGIMQSA